MWYFRRIWAVTHNSDLGFDNTQTISHLSLLLSTQHCEFIVLTAPPLLWRGFTDSALTECHPQPRTRRSSINTALLIDALLREHKEPVTDCHKRLRRSEKRAAGACSRGLWIANVEHMKPVPGLWLPDFIMPPLSPLMISLLRHARLQRGPQLHHNSATLRRACKRCSRLCLFACLRGHVCATYVAPFLEWIQEHVHDFTVQKNRAYFVTGVIYLLLEMSPWETRRNGLQLLYLMTP